MRERKIQEREQALGDQSVEARSSASPEGPATPGPAGSVYTGRPWLRRFRGPAAMLGRGIEWVCPTGAEQKKACCSDRCQLWVLCQCSREEFRSSGLLEGRVWWLLAACGAAVILYWLLAV